MNDADRKQKLNQMFTAALHAEAEAVKHRVDLHTILLGFEDGSVSEQTVDGIIDDKPKRQVLGSG